MNIVAYTDETGAHDPILRRASADWGDDDGCNERSGAVEIGIAFRQDVDRGEVVFAEQIGQPAEPPAQNHYVSGGEGEREFLRRCVLVVLGMRVWFERVINQLTGMEAMSVLLAEMELDRGAILDGGGIAVVFGGVHRVIEG